MFNLINSEHILTKETNLSSKWIRSIDELRASAIQWDDLWQRSEITTPMARAEMLAQWLEHFAPGKIIQIQVLQDKKKWIAALPLKKTKVRHLISAAGLCGSTWIPCGCLLADASMDLANIMDALVSELPGLPWPLVWLQGVALDSLRWQAFQRAIERAGMINDVEVEYQTGILHITHDWEAYKSSWTKKHRHKMRRCIKLADENKVQFRLLLQFSPEDVEILIQRAFNLENLGWKGTAGSSVLRRGQFDFLLRQARQLAEWQQLVLAFLEMEKQPIAFAYGYHSKGVHHVCKIGYDPNYADMSPGQLLFYYLLEQLYADRETQALDFMGKLTQAIACWQPSPLPLGRIAIAPQRLLGRLVLYCYRFRKHN
jgi:hypothetical protein